MSRRMTGVAGAPDRSRTKKRPGRAGAFKFATKAPQGVDYLPLEAGADSVVVVVLDLT